MKIDNLQFPNAVTNLDPNLCQIYGRFGFEKTLLLPLTQDGQPTVPYLDKHTINQSHSAAIQSELARSHIAVMLGPVSNNLCCIACHEDAVEDFLTINPVLHQTTQQQSGKLVRLFVRMDGAFPKSKRDGAVGWISSGYVAIHSPVLDSGYEFINDTPPLTLRFDKIVWPADMTTTFALEMLATEHPVTVRDHRGRETINYHYVIGQFKLVNDAKFDPATRNFYRTLGGKIEYIYVETIKAELQKILLLLQRAAGGRLHVNTSPRHLKELSELLSIAVTEPLKDNENSIDEFVTGCVGKQSGANVTVAELFSSYLDFCKEVYPPFSKRQFETRIATVVHNRFGIIKRHDIRRDSRSQRGFHNLERSLRTVRTVRTDQFQREQQISDNVVRLFVGN